MTVAALSVQVAVAVFTAMTALAAWRSARAAESSVRQTRDAHEQEFRPLVSVYVEAEGRLLHIVVENFGRHPAATIEIRFQEMILNSAQRELATHPLFRHAIPLLPPGKRLRVLLDDRPSFFRAKPQMRWRYSLSYRDPLLNMDYRFDELQLSAAHLEPSPDEYFDLVKFYEARRESQ